MPSIIFAQDWSDTGLITTDDDWSGVPNVIGYRGDGLTSATGTDPQTITADGTDTPVDVNANQTNPNTFTTGGLAEFAISNPVVALNGSGTADAPFLLINLNTAGFSTINVSYNLRDLDGSTDNSIQPIALQYRVGSIGNFINLPNGFVADASSGPSLATLVTPVSVQLPTNADNQSQVQVRVITTNAAGNDEWIGIDDIVVTGETLNLIPGVTIAQSGTGTDVNEAGLTTDTYTIALNTIPTGPISVTITADGQTLLSTNGTSFANSLTVNLADTTPQTITVQAVDDAIAESSPHTGIITHSITSSSDPAYPTNLAISNVNVNIIDNDGISLRIRDIQGEAHISPLLASASSTVAVTNVPGIVTAIASNGFYIQDPSPDTNPATSEGIFVFTGTTSPLRTARTIGEAVLVTGTVSEFRPGGDPDNLTITQIGNNASVQTLSVGPWTTAPTNVISPVVIPTDRTPPTSSINNDFVTTGNVETGGDFDPATEGIDFYESLEGMLVQVTNPLVVSPTNGFGEIWVVANNGAGATGVSSRGAIVIDDGDFNPERIQIDDTLTSTSPVVGVGTTLNNVTGVVSYSFENYELLSTSPIAVASPSTLQREVTNVTSSTNELTISSFNVENLDPSDGTRFNDIANIIVNNLKSPDILSLEEIQDNNGATNDSIVDASVTLQTLINAIAAAGGPTYEFRQINPVDDTNGGEPGGNIRVAFLFNPNRVDFVDRPGGDATTPITVTSVNGDTPEVSLSPGLIDPNNPAFNNSRKPLVGEFLFNGRTVFVVGNHFNSKGGDGPLFGPTQPPQLVTEPQRIQQATIVADFVQDVLAVNSNANVVVLGDLNEFQFFEPVNIIERAGLNNLTETLPTNERYTIQFQGNSQALDHILVSNNLFNNLSGYDIVHVNSEFVDQVSDHDPAVARFNLPQIVINGTLGRDTLTGGYEGEVIVGGAGRDIITTGSGNDQIVYNRIIDGGDIITDFEVGKDKLVFTELLDRVVLRGNYTGTDAIADGYISFRQEGASAVVLFDPNARGFTPQLPFITLQNVSVADLNNVNNFVF